MPKEIPLPSHPRHSPTSRPPRIPQRRIQRKDILDSGDVHTGQVALRGLLSRRALGPRRAVLRAQVVHE